MKNTFTQLKSQLVFSLRSKIQARLLRTALPVLAILLSFTARSQYCNSNFNSVCCEWVTNVTFGGINNSSSALTGPPANYTTQVANVIPGIATNMNITIQSDCGSEYVYVYIDWNQNGVLNDLGEVYTVASNVGNCAILALPAFAITPPFSAVPGTTRMRVMCAYGGASPNPCMSITYGEAEDYSVNVIPPTPCSSTPASNSVVATTTLVCPVFGTSGLTLANTYTLGGMTYSWQSSTGSALGPWTNIPGANGISYTTPTLNATTYYQVAIGCSNGGSTIAATPVQVQVASTTTNNVPYLESFEGITQNKQLPNCSWTRTNNYQNSTQTASVSTSRIARTGNKFAEFDASDYVYYNIRSYYSNGIQLYAGVTYSASVWYITPGYATWFNLTLLVGPNQNATGQMQLAQVSNPNSSQYTPMSNTFTVATSGLYYLAVRAQENYYGSYLAWDDLEIIAPCSFANNGANITVQGPSQICAGQTANYTASGAGTYSWNTGANTASLSVAPPFTTTYSITGTNPLTGCYTTLAQQLQVNQLPPVSIVNFNPNICVGSSTSMFATNAVTYTWSSGAQTSAVSVTPPATQVYTVMGADALGCVGTATQLVTVNPLPVISIVPPSKTICKGEAANLTASGATGATNYQWASSDIYLQGANVSAYPQTTTTFTVSGTDGNGCTGSTNIVVTVDACVGISTVANSSVKATVYPNPNNGEFIVELNNNLNKNIEVIDLTGRIVAATSTDHNQVRVNLSQLANGVYYVKIKSGSSTETLKVVKN